MKKQKFTDLLRSTDILYILVKNFIENYNPKRCHQIMCPLHRRHHSMYSSVQYTLYIQTKQNRTFLYTVL